MPDGKRRLLVPAGVALLVLMSLTVACSSRNPSNQRTAGPPAPPIATPTAIQERCTMLACAPGTPFPAPTAIAGGNTAAPIPVPVPPTSAAASNSLQADSYVVALLLMMIGGAIWAFVVTSLITAGDDDVNYFDVFLLAVAVIALAYFSVAILFTWGQVPMADLFAGMIFWLASLGGLVWAVRNAGWSGVKRLLLIWAVWSFFG